MSTRGYYELSIDCHELIIAGMNFLERSGKITQIARGSLDKTEGVEKQVKKVKFSNVVRGLHVYANAEYLPEKNESETSHTSKENGIKYDGCTRCKEHEVKIDEFKDIISGSCKLEDGAGNLSENSKEQSSDAFCLFAEMFEQIPNTHSLHQTGRRSAISECDPIESDGLWFILKEYMLRKQL